MLRCSRICRCSRRDSGEHRGRAGGGGCGWPCVAGGFYSQDFERSRKSVPREPFVVWEGFARCRRRWPLVQGWGWGAGCVPALFWLRGSSPPCTPSHPPARRRPRGSRAACGEEEGISDVSSLARSHPVVRSLPLPRGAAGPVTAAGPRGCHVAAAVLGEAAQPSAQRGGFWVPLKLSKPS